MFFFSAILVPFFTEWGKQTLSEIFILNAWFFFWNFVLEVPPARSPTSSAARRPWRWAP